MQPNNSSAIRRAKTESGKIETIRQEIAKVMHYTLNEWRSLSRSDYGPKVQLLMQALG
jgi:hypothetical protein